MTTSARRSAAPRGISSAHAPALDLPARFMVLGMCGFLTVAAVAPWAAPLLLHSFSDHRLLAFVHLNTLGVVAAVILGASYQLVPVVLQTPLASARVGRLSFWFYLAGLLLFLPSLLTAWLPGLALGSTLLLLAFSLYIGVIGITIRRAPYQDVISWHISAALVSLGGGIVLGVLLAFNKGLGFLGGMTANLLAAHVTLMLAGWVAVLLAGVAYRLVGMFTLSEDALWQPGAWIELALMTTGAWVLAAAFLFSIDGWLRLTGGAMLLAGQGMYLAELTRLYRLRRRRAFDIHIPFALTSAGLGFTAAALLVVGFALGVGAGGSLWVAAGWLAIAGLAETAIQGFFYKITTFLVWLHRYAPQAGRKRVPRLEDLYQRRLAVAGWVYWTTGLALSAAAIATGSQLISLFAGLGLSTGLACFLVNVIRIGGHWKPIRIGLMEFPRVSLSGGERMEERRGPRSSNA
ncbi:MAG TPA: hypothetical protein VFS96_07340 [Nitrolancea sp.]|nr:hypothetical protein [Nitrolancea sp.]